MPAAGAACCPAEALPGAAANTRQSATTERMAAVQLPILMGVVRRVRDLMAGETNRLPSCCHIVWKAPPCHSASDPPLSGCPAGS